MRSAPGLVYLLGRGAALLGPWAILAVSVAAVVLGILVAVQLLVDPEPLLLAPLRWVPRRLALLEAAGWT